MITVKAKYNIDLGKSVTNATADLLNGTLNESGTITTFTPIKAITGSGNNSFSHNGNGDISVNYFTNKADSIAELVKAFVL